MSFAPLGPVASGLSRFLAVAFVAFDKVDARALIPYPRPGLLRRQSLPRSIKLSQSEVTVMTGMYSTGNLNY